MSFLLNRVFRHSPAWTSIFKMSRIWHSGIDTENIPTVKHDRAAQCFTVSLGTAGNYDTAILRYSLTGDGEVNLLTTNVPDSFRGEGIAAHLAKAALDFVVEEKLKAHISCWYIRKYVEENSALGYKNHIVS
ncbi:protein NATD1 isoform X2 [Clupea harengus]|uniref:Protein NATD1 n=1 Tax=Clupea harengus TaxID=7950 RepID=A0A6P3WD45_CLUHA|nr:protein NATD1 isoform X2 [Clupea harengus]